MIKELINNLTIWLKEHFSAEVAGRHASRIETMLRVEGECLIFKPYGSQKDFHTKTTFLFKDKKVLKTLSLRHFALYGKSYIDSGIGKSHKLLPTCGKARCINPAHQQEVTLTKNQSLEEIVHRLEGEAYSDPMSGCLMLSRASDECGYSLVRLGVTLFRAHRLVCSFYTGIPIRDVYACHTCDNPSCININHLYNGSPKQNSEDRERRGRGVRPRTHPKEVVDKILYLKKMGLTAPKISEETGVSLRTVYTLWNSSDDKRTSL
jgi:hypothetical protein